MSYWKTRVAPRIHEVFHIGHKKAAAADACKAFDASKEEINKEFEEKKEELKPKVLDIYSSSPPEIKSLLKKKRTDFKKHSKATNKFLQDLVTIDFPGSKQVSEASSKYKPALVSSSIVFIFEKVATFIPEEPPAAEREVVVEEKKEEVKEGEGATSAESLVEEKEEPKKDQESPSKPEEPAKPAEVVEEVKVVEPPKVEEPSKKT